MPQDSTTEELKIPLDMFRKLLVWGITTATGLFIGWMIWVTRSLSSLEQDAAVIKTEIRLYIKNQSKLAESKPYESYNAPEVRMLADGTFTNNPYSGFDIHGMRNSPKSRQP